MYSYEDLKKAPVGTRITFENGEELVRRWREHKYDDDCWGNESYIRNNEDLKNMRDNYAQCELGKIIKIEEPEYKTVYEVKKILDKKEKEYLSTVIKPFRNRVMFIKKSNYCYKAKMYECIEICLKDLTFAFPFFEEGTMYRGMETDKEYSLEELDL